MEITLTEEYQEFLWAIYVVFLRIGPALALSPAYGENSVPVRLKLIGALMMSVALAPTVPFDLSTYPKNGMEFSKLVLSETTFGFFLGLSARGVLFLLQHAANTISHSVSFAQITGNLTEPLPVLGHFFTIAGLALITSGELGHQIIFIIGRSYDISWQIFYGGLGAIAQTLSEQLNYIFRNGTVLAMGFIAMFFVYHLFLGFVNKAMPQFMVTFVGIPFVALATMVYLHRSAEPILTMWQEKSLSIMLSPVQGFE